MKNLRLKNFCLIFVAFSLLFGATAAWGYEIPKFEGYVNDWASLFTPKEKSAIESLAKEVNSDFPDTMVIVLTLPDIVKDRATLARQVMSAWNMKDTDVLIMLAVSGKNANLRIDPGVKLVNILTDSRIKKFKKAMVADLSKKRFGEGFISGVGAIYNELKSARSSQRTSNFLFSLIVLTLIMVAIITWRRRSRQTAEARTAMSKRLSVLLDNLMNLSREVDIQISLAKELSEAARSVYAEEIKFLEGSLLSDSMKNAGALQQSLGSTSVSEAERRLKKMEKDYQDLKEASESLISLLQGKAESRHGESHIRQAALQTEETGVHQTGPRVREGHREEVRSHHGGTVQHSERVIEEKSGDVDVTIIPVITPGYYPGAGVPAYEEPAGSPSSQSVEPESDQREESFRLGGEETSRRESEAPLIVDPFSSKDDREESLGLGGEDQRESAISLSSSGDQREESFSLSEDSGRESSLGISESSVSESVSSEGTSY